MEASAVSWKRLRTLAVFLAAVGALLLPAGSAVADEPTPEDAPPAIVGGAVTPSTLSYEGGNAQIQAEITDDVGLQMVSAQVYGSNGSNQTIQLFEGYEDNYFGTLEVPANDSDSQLNYEVEIQAYDTNNAYVASSIGGVQVEGRPQFDEYPYVSEPQLTPSFLPPEGGTVTISAEASDTGGISTVFATIALPGGGSAEVPLNPVSSSRYEGTFTVPANSGPLGAEYLVEIVAQDSIGQESRVLAGTITVEAPPPLPSAGQLELWPSERYFGSVAVGKRALRRVFVQNLPRRGGEEVDATATVTGSPTFSLLNAPPEGIHFTLQPGEKRSFLVAFRPTTAGPHSGSLQIGRDDGGQPELAVALSGRGQPAKGHTAK
jgi:hypothetical protein